MEEHKLVRCAGCNTWQHDCWSKCPKCGRLLCEEYYQESLKRAQEKREREKESRARGESKLEFEAKEVQRNLEEAKETLAKAKQEADSKKRQLSGIKRNARKAVQRSKDLSMLCITKYDMNGKLPSASAMTKLLYKETGTIFSTNVLISYLKKYGYERTTRGWRRIE